MKFDFDQMYSQCKDKLRDFEYYIKNDQAISDGEYQPFIDELYQEMGQHNSEIFVHSVNNMYSQDDPPFISEDRWYDFETYGEEFKQYYEPDVTHDEIISGCTPLISIDCLLIHFYPLFLKWSENRTIHILEDSHRITGDVRKYSGNNDITTFIDGEMVYFRKIEWKYD